MSRVADTNGNSILYFRIVAGASGLRRRTDSAISKMIGSFQYVAFLVVLFTASPRTPKGIFGSPISLTGFFSYPPEARSDKFAGPILAVLAVLTSRPPYRLILGGEGYGSDSMAVVSFTGRTVKSAPRTDPSTGWARAGSAVFDSIPTAPSGQLRKAASAV